MTSRRASFGLFFWGSIALVWALTVALAAWLVIVPVAQRALQHLPAALPALLLAFAAATVIWGYGLLQLAHWAANPAARALLRREQRAVMALPRAATDIPPRVMIVAPVADDFRPEILRRALAQSVPVACAILDDSRGPDARHAIDLFAAETGARVIRRTDRRAYKAGNLNHALPQLLTDADFLVIVDSDSEIPSDFVARALPHFADPAVGVVQGRPWTRNGSTPFARELRELLGGLLAATQANHAVVGLSPFLGRGGMFSAACLRAVGGFPERVFEDVSVSIALRTAGFRTVYLDDVECAEDYPVDYRAFRVQYGKHAEGCAELLRERGLLRGLSVRERLDVRLSLAMPLALSVAGLTLLGANLALTILGAAPVGVGLPLPVMAAVAVGASAPLLPVVLRLVIARHPIRALRFAVAAGALYSTVLVLGIARTFRVLLGARGRFRVTPKTATSAGMGAVVRALRAEWLVAGGALALALALAGTFAPLMPLMLPALFGTVFALWPQRRHRAPWDATGAVNSQPRVGATS